MWSSDNRYKKKRMTNNLTLIKPDKINSTIITSQRDLDNKTEKCIVNNNCITLNMKILQINIKPNNKYTIKPVSYTHLDVYKRQHEKQDKIRTEASMEIIKYKQNFKYNRENSC